MWFKMWGTLILDANRCITNYINNKMVFGHLF